MSSRLPLLIVVALLLATVAQAAPRSRTARQRFLVLSGYPHGRPGYVVDHIVPLCAGGLDAPSNMQWQTIADAHAKDRLERAQCRALHRRSLLGQMEPDMPDRRGRFNVL